MKEILLIMICALPGKLYNIPPRLFCIRHTENIVILGNGGIKFTRTTQEDEHLNKCIILLKNVDKLLKSSIKRGKTHMYNKILYGRLEFIINIHDQS